MLVVNILPFQTPLPQVLPTIEGNVDYREFRRQLLRIDQLLSQGGARRSTTCTSDSSCCGG